jgi:hypothetical protein
MSDDDKAADELISGSLKPARPYHADYCTKKYSEIKRLATKKPVDRKARQMKKADRTSGKTA